VGILTDRDLRCRVLAPGLPLETKVEAVMTPSPQTIAASRTVLDALIMMSERNFHHLPVVDADGTLVGMVSANDVLAAQSLGAMPIARAVSKASTVEDVARTLKRLPGMAANLIDGSVDGAPAASQIASVGLAVHRRIIELAEAALGQPPVPYCFLVFGSLARRDQTLSTDQDNGLLLSDRYDPVAHGDYFKALAERISADLDACGYPFCGGDIMATNTKWGQNLADWKATFENWIRAPEPKALMHASIFFDSAAVWGDTSLRDALMAHVLPRAEKNRLFLAHMVENALSSKVPIGFFRRFVLTHDKNHEDRLDIKKSGLVALVDIVRAHALAHGIEAPGFADRIEALRSASDIAGADLQEMLDAWNFMMTIRLGHQVRQVKQGDAPDNLIAPAHLSAFEREHLRDAFSLIKTHQGGLSRALAGGHY
jgi:CBS domain-containing protein